MANPNIVNVSTINGATTYLIPANTSPTVLLSNAASSSTVYKIETLQVSNVTASAVSVTASINSAAAGSGTAYRFAYQISVPANSTLTLIDKGTPFYLTENTSLVVTSGTGSALEYVCSYESIA